MDKEGIMRVRGRMDSAIMSYKMKHLAILLIDHKITCLLMQEANQCRLPGVVTTAAETSKGLTNSRPGENNQVQVCLLQRNGAGDRDADYG